jgi:hypothetical protein
VALGGPAGWLAGWQAIRGWRAAHHDARDPRHPLRDQLAVLPKRKCCLQGHVTVHLGAAVGEEGATVQKCRAGHGSAKRKSGEGVACDCLPIASCSVAQVHTRALWPPCSLVFQPLRTGPFAAVAGPPQPPPTTQRRRSRRRAGRGWAARQPPAVLQDHCRRPCTGASLPVGSGSRGIRHRSGAASCRHVEKGAIGGAATVPAGTRLQVWIATGQAVRDGLRKWHRAQHAAQKPPLAHLRHALPLPLLPSPSTIHKNDVLHGHCLQLHTARRYSWRPPSAAPACGSGGQDAAAGMPR